MANSLKCSQWLSCPLCHATARVKAYEDTVLINFPLYCTRCKREFIVGVIKFKMVVSDEPDALSAEPAAPE